MDHVGVSSLIFVAMLADLTNLFSDVIFAVSKTQIVINQTDPFGPVPNPNTHSSDTLSRQMFGVIGLFCGIDQERTQYAPRQVRG